MKLNKQKELAARVLGVGKGRIRFVKSRLEEIQEALTRQDITDLHESGAIEIKECHGRKKVVKRKHRRGVGRVKKKVNKSKREYIIITRKLRATLRGLLRMEKITKEDYVQTRKMIRASKFKSRRHMLEGLSK